MLAKDKPGLRAMCGSGRLHAGHFVIEFATPGIGHILAGAGAEFCFLDMEHSGFSFETVKATLRVLRAAGVAPLVRVPSGAYHHVARALDCGAEGVMVPMVATADQAASLVRHARYWPEGAAALAFGPIARVTHQGGRLIGRGDHRHHHAFRATIQRARDMVIGAGRHAHQGRNAGRAQHAQRGLHRLEGEAGMLHVEKAEFRPGAGQDVADAWGCELDHEMPSM